MPENTHLTKAPDPIEPLSGTSIHVRDDFRSKPVRDWDYWKMLDLWTIGQAVCLVCDCDPGQLESPYHPLRTQRHHGAKAKKLWQVFKIAVSAIEAGNLKLEDPFTSDFYKKIKPEYFITWAKGKGLPLPDNLVESDPDAALASEIEVLIKAASLEIEYIYRAIKKGVGLSGRIADRENRWCKVAIASLKGKFPFKLVTDKDLSDKSLYMVRDTKEKEDFIGSLLKKIVENEGFKAPGKKKLYDKYLKINKK